MGHDIDNNAIDRQYGEYGGRRACAKPAPTTYARTLAAAMLAQTLRRRSFQPMSANAFKGRTRTALDVLEAHYAAFQAAVGFARDTDHPVPVDTRAWSQILVSVLTGIAGLKRKKGADLSDGSDVKAASTWEAIDTPRFNGVLKAGTKATTAGTLASLDSMPFLFFVLWDHTAGSALPRCRIWCVRPQLDAAFREICAAWYGLRDSRHIRSNNFQLHPPRNKDANVFRNKCGCLAYPLLFCAERRPDRWALRCFDPTVLKKGICSPAG